MSLSYKLSGWRGFDREEGKRQKREVKMSYYCHITPGRVRIKTPVIKQNRLEAQRICELLHSLSGIEAVSINDLTGSVTINYRDRETDCESILKILEEQGYYRNSETENMEFPIETIVSKVGTTIGKAILGVAVEKALEGSMLSFLALLV
jgi:copper chaperone CopZ